VKILRHNEDMQLLRRIVGDNAPRHFRSYVLVLALMGVAAGCTAAVVYILGNVINTIYERKEFAAVVALAATMMGIFTLRGFATYGHAVLLARIGNEIIAENQRRLIDRLLSQGIGYFARIHSAEIVSRASNGAAAATNLLNLLVVTLGRDLLTVLGLIVVMVWQDPWMTLLSLVIMPVAVLGVRELVRKSNIVSRNRLQAMVNITQILQETVQGVRVIKAFNSEGLMRRRLSSEIDEVTHANNQLARIANQSSPLMEALGGFAIALVCLYAGYRVVQVGDDPGRFVSFMAAFLMAFAPVRRIARLNIELSQSLVAARGMYELIDEQATEPDDTHLPPLLISEGRVVFHDVRFGYRLDLPVLKGVSLAAEPDQLTALMGPSGGGKSTIFALLMRFYVPEAGTIWIDGQDIGDASRVSLRNQIAYVGQDVFLFQGTIRDNLLIGREKAAQDDIEAAAKAALAHDFIMALPKGYDTVIGEFGWDLSLGQRQRLSIARAFLRNARIILLDEPTASLDSESELAVQSALQDLCAGRTTIVIAHRLTTIRHANQIYFVEDGVIAEHGSEQELRDRGGRYETFFQLQFPEHAERDRGRAHRAPIKSATSGA
jgi:ATP-binding cassette subfamily B protein